LFHAWPPYRQAAEFPINHPSFYSCNGREWGFVTGDPSGVREILKSAC
jgi:hypothetical protein